MTLGGAAMSGGHTMGNHIGCLGALVMLSPTTDLVEGAQQIIVKGGSWTKIISNLCIHKFSSISTSR